MSEAMIEGFRLSPQQQHVWSLQSADANTPYRAQGTILIEGPIDPTRLLAALTDVIERYEILRTTFQYLQGMALPLQMVAEPSALAMPFYDLAKDGASAAGELQN
nr:hypothetical protein [Herpetosiphonaceae bacterium]